MSPLEQLTQKIIAVVPSIEQGYTVIEIHEKQSNGVYRTKSVKGRPILLEDVLIVLQDSLIPMGDYSLDSGYINFYKIESDEPEIEWSWKLNTPLHLQSEETIGELNKLI